MGRVPPPPPLTSEQFRRARESGARTLFELDPELGRWYRSRRVFHAVAVSAVAAGVFVLAAVAGLIIR